MAVGTAFASPLLDAGQIRKYAYRNRMGMVPSAEFDVFHEDFHSFMVSTAITNGPAANTPWGWQSAIIDTGATIVADTTVGNHTGAILFDSDGAGEGAAIYTTESFQLVSGKRTIIECRVKLEVANDCDFYFGLTDVAASTNPEDLWTNGGTNMANGVVFGVTDGTSGYPRLLCDKSDGGSSAVTQTLKALSNATWHTLGIEHTGSGVAAYIDGDKVITWTGTYSSTVPTGVTLALFAGYLNGSSANNEAQLDYIRIVSER